MGAFGKLLFVGVLAGAGALVAKKMLGSPGQDPWQNAGAWEPPAAPAAERVSDAAHSAADSVSDAAHSAADSVSDAAASTAETVTDAVSDATSS